MVLKTSQSVKEKLGGEGEGKALVRMVLPSDKLNDKGRMFNHIWLEPQSSISYHQHVGETEWYYIIKGHGAFHDNGKDVEVFEGDVCVTNDQEFHSLKNIGDDVLEMIALILYK
jgi:mannose-6-phosphate isomerase-like protein (cupin superfamily)